MPTFVGNHDMGRIGYFLQRVDQTTADDAAPWISTTAGPLPSPSSRTRIRRSPMSSLRMARMVTRSGRRAKWRGAGAVRPSHEKAAGRSVEPQRDGAVSLFERVLYGPHREHRHRCAVQSLCLQAKVAQEHRADSNQQQSCSEKGQGQQREECGDVRPRSSSVDTWDHTAPAADPVTCLRARETGVRAPRRFPCPFRSTRSTTSLAS